ncbi:MAG: hypothetical protein HDT43_11060 [Ruminococcaceae bacterium]|nr:hypothetical protein [Oscillospiraceae bacterium]
MCNVKFKLPAIGVIIAALLFFMPGTSAAASSEAHVELTANGSEARLVMDFPQAAAEEIASMQISLVVSEGADIEFVPDGGLAAKIVESRFHPDTGVLTIYLAGTKALFSDTPLTVGTIKLGSGAAAVGVAEGSIKFVRGSELVSPSDVVYPSVVTISTGSANTPAGIPDTSFAVSFGNNVTPDEPDEPNEPNDPFFEPVELADTSSLENAVERAEAFKRGDFTEESFNTLTEALDKARAVLSNESSTQDEVDEALLVLENAIGMLTSSHTAPSGTDDYNISGLGGDTSITGTSSTTKDFGEAVVPNPPEINQSGVIDGQSDVQSDQSDVQSDTTSDKETEKKNNTVIWIAVVTAVLAAAAIAAALVLKKKKK